MCLSDAPVEQNPFLNHNDGPGESQSPQLTRARFEPAVIIQTLKIEEETTMMLPFTKIFFV